MSALAPPLERVVTELCKLPGIGRKTAQRLAYHLLKAPVEDTAALARALDGLHAGIRACPVCFNLTSEDLCAICTDARRDRSAVCVVEDPANVTGVERTGAFRGMYHVLGGSLAPLKDIGPDDLHIRELLERVGAGEIREVVLATNPDVEGEATAVYLARLLRPLGMHVTRLAQGLPVGADLEFTDDLTLKRAIEGRRDSSQILAGSLPACDRRT